MLDAPGPVVLLGRGGSGTRMMSALAALCGVFLGNRLNESGDSIEWVDVIYRLAVAHLDDPGRREEADVAALRMRAQDILAQPSAGIRLWGWKLPETMLILPSVLAAFPTMRVVHLVRHPITSALRRTHRTSRLTNPIGRAVLTAAAHSRGMTIDRLGELPETIHNALSWDFQVRNAIRILDRHPGVPVATIRYDAVCDDPQSVVAALAGFVGQPVPTARYDASIDRARIAAITDETAAMEAVWDICGETAERLGFGYDDWRLETTGRPVLSPA